MTLKEYIQESGFSLRTLAKLWNIDPAQLSRYSNGHILPSMKTAGRISELTDGKVGMDSWVQKKTSTKS